MLGNLFFWNVRGINEIEKHPALRRWLNTTKVSFGALLETHVKEPNLNHFMDVVCPNWSYVSNHSEDAEGRIIVMWKAPLTVVVLHKSKQSVTCKVNWPGIPSFYYTAVYAANTSEERIDLWVELIGIHSTLLDDFVPWLVGGDFNETIHPSEHSGHHANHITIPMRDFKACLDQLELKDLKYHGPLFTRTNKQPDDPIAKKLDRALINEHWFSAFPQCLATFMAPDISDHSPCCITLASPITSAGTRPFKFFNFLASHPDFLITVADSWSCTVNQVPSLLSLSFKQKEIKRALKTLHKDNYSDIQKRVSEAKRVFISAQQAAFLQPNNSTFQHERDCLEILSKLRLVEESYFRQKSRINWLQTGDQNTDYFQKMAKGRNCYNSIHTLTGMDGCVVFTPSDVGNLAVDHF